MNISKTLGVLAIVVTSIFNSHSTLAEEKDYIRSLPDHGLFILQDAELLFRGAANQAGNRKPTTLQFVGVSKLSSAEKTAKKLADVFPVFIYQTVRNAKPWYIVTAGLYDDNDIAKQDLEMVKEEYKDAFVKPLKSVIKDLDREVARKDNKGKSKQTKMQALVDEVYKETKQSKVAEAPKTVKKAKTKKAVVTAIQKDLVKQKVEEEFDINNEIKFVLKKGTLKSNLKRLFKDLPITPLFTDISERHFNPTEIELVAEDLPTLVDEIVSAYRTPYQIRCRFYKNDIAIFYYDKKAPGSDVGTAS